MSEEAEAEILAEIANVAQDGLSTVDNVVDPSDEGSNQRNSGANGIMNEEIYDDPGTPLGDEDQDQEDQARPESEEEDDIQITIGDIRSNVTTFRPQGTGAQRGAVVGGTGAAKQGQKLDLDATAEVNGTSIYDLDLSLLEERPWRKPGADLTDYFNYGFTEESWLIYCDRQKKLRSEYGAAANKVLFASITVPTNVPNSTNLGSNLQTQQKQHQHVQAMKVPDLPVIMRTNLMPPKSESPPSSIQPMVLTPAVPTPAMQFTDLPKEPTSSLPMSVPSLASSVPMSQMLLQNMQQQANAHLDSSPPVSPGGTPPLSDEFPTRQSSEIPVTLATTSMQPQVTPSSSVDVSGPPPSVTITPGAGGEPAPMHFPDLSMPPPRFPTNLPPPGFGPPPPGIPGVPGMPPTNVPPPMFPPGSMPPPGMPLRFPPPFGFPPPVGRMPPPYAREAYAGFNPSQRDEARSPASYSDKSSDEESSRRDKYDSRSSRHGSYRPSMSRGMGPPGYGREREKSSYRSSRHRSRSRGRDSSRHRDDRHRSRDRDYRERSKHRRADDDEEKPKKHKIKEEIEDDESPEKPSKKSKEKSERKERSSKKKRKKDRRDDDEEEDTAA